MNFNSIIDDILRRFSSIDIIIEPEESAVREAVNKLRGGDSKYFDGVKKIVVEHGNPKSPYLGKATGDGIVYISLDAIKNQLDSQGLKGNHLAFVNELLKTLGHEVAHIRGDLAPTESPSEVEEQILEQRFPTPAMEKSAALTDDQKRAITLKREMAELKDKLNLLHGVWKQLSSSESGGTLDPSREAHFKSEDARIKAEIAAKRADLDLLEGSLSRAPAPAPAAPAASPVPSAPLQKTDDVVKYIPIFESLSASISGALTGLVKLQQILSNAPTFVRGEVRVLGGLRKITSAIDLLHKKVDSRLGAASQAPHLFGKLPLERIFEEAEEALLSASEFLTSERDFVRPLTNQGVEVEFYNSAVAPVVSEVLLSIKSAAGQVAKEHGSLLQVPEFTAVPQNETRTPSKTMLRSGPEGKQRGERSLDAIRDDYISEYKDLSGKLDEARKLLQSSVGNDRLAPLIARKDELESGLKISKDTLNSVRAELEAMVGRSSDRDTVIKQQNLSKRYQDMKSSISDAEAELSKLRSEIASLYDVSGVNPDELINIIAPYSNVNSVESRFETVSKKLEKFKFLDERKKLLISKRDELNRSRGTADADPAELQTLELLVEKTLPKEISELEGELASVSSPKPRNKDPEMARVRDALKANMKLFESPLVQSMFEKIMPDVVTGGELRNKRKLLERKLQMRTKNVAPETDYDEMSGIIPADTEILNWQAQINDAKRNISYRQNGEMLEYLGRLGQALGAIIQKNSGDSSASMPMDILGPNLRLNNYDQSAGNAKIIRDLESIVSANARTAQILSGEFSRLQTDMSQLDKSSGDDSLVAERLKAKRKYLAAQPTYQKFRSDVATTIERLVGSTVPVATETPITPKTVRERDRTPGIPDSVVRRREREEGEIAKELGFRSDVEPREPTRTPDFAERAKSQSRQWEQPAPLGRALLSGAVKKDIELGLIDPQAVPPEVRKELLNRLHSNSKEMRNIKERLGKVDAELLKLKQERVQLDSEAPVLGEDGQAGAGSIDPQFHKQRMEKNRIQMESLEKGSGKLRIRAQELHSEVGKIRDILKDPEKYLYDAPVLERRLEGVLADQDALLSKKYGLEDELTGLESDLAVASGDSAEALKSQIQATKKSISEIESKLKLTEKRVEEIERLLGKARATSGSGDMGKALPSDRPSVRVFEPTDSDRERVREHARRYTDAVERGVEDKAKKYRQADKAERAAMYRRRDFVDLGNPTKQLPSTKLLNASRAMRYAYKRALELNPVPDTSRESRVRAALYKQTELDNYLRVLDDEYLKQATEQAEAATGDVQEQFRLRAQYLDELHASPEYTQATDMLQQALDEMDAASVIDRPEGAAALEAVVQKRDMGKGVGDISGKKERMLGAKDPYMLFFRAQYEAEVALMRYEEAAKAKKQLDAARAKARSKAASDGLGESEIEATVDREYNELLQSLMTAQYESLSKFDSIVEKLKETTDGSKPSVFFDPSKVQGYLRELISKQAAAVREKELARRFTQVRETPLVTANTFDPDRFPKLLATEFSNEMPTVSEFARQQSGGEGVYKKLRFVLPHVLWGQKSPEKKDRKGKVTSPSESGDSRESPFTETVKHKYHPAPIKPGGKGQRGDNVPQFMQSKSRK